MAGKAPVFASGRLYYALDKLSKNALIDLVADRARAEVGEDASDERIAEVIQGWLVPVFQYRGDRPVSLAGMMTRLDKNDEDYRNKTGRYRQVQPSAEQVVANDLGRKLQEDARLAYNPSSHLPSVEGDEEETFPGNEPKTPGPRVRIPATKMPRS